MIPDRLSAALADRYRLERELGQGGMATVYLARDSKHEREVALKVLRPELGAVLGSERFLAEIKITARLDHPHILTLIDSGASDGFLYYVLPYVRGESLRDKLNREKQFGVDEALLITKQVASALDYAHRQGVVHRDIKPENILLQEGEAMLADFGIALAVKEAGGHRLTETGLSLGTPQYMSPEQATGDRQLDARSDVYSLGAVLYEMLAGEPPVTGPNAQAMIAKLMTERPIRLRVVRDTVPEGIDTAVAKALSKLPADRFSSAAAFSQALSRPAVDSTTVIESRAEASRLRRVSWWTGRRAALVGVVVLLIAAALAVRRYGASRTSAPRSLAVLPFETVGNDTANAYFAEGIAEEVTNALAQVPGLRIAGRRSAIRFSGKGASAEQIGAALDVGAVLEGTVRRAGDQIRVSAQLTSASDGLVLWSQSYPRELKDVFAVQEEIARAIAGALQVAFASGDGADRAARGTTDLEAYDLYLKGLYFYRRRGTGTAITQSLASLEQAVARDSSFARAQAALATALLVLPYYSLTHMGEVLPPARAAARRAARLDPALADAHTALGIAHEEAFEWDEAEAEYRRAIALDPNAAEARYRLGRTFVMQRRIPEAIAGLRLAKAHDPLYFFTATYLGWALTQAGEHDAGIAELRRGLELEPNALPPLTFLTFSYYSANRPDSAAVFARRLAVASSIPVRLGGSAFVLARIGHREEAEALVRRLEALPAGTWTRSSSLAFGYLGLGDTTRALAAMERAAATDGDLLITYLGVLAGDLWSSPRFAAVLRRFNLDPARMGGHAVAPASSKTMMNDASEVPGRRHTGPASLIATPA